MGNRKFFLGVVLFITSPFSCYRNISLAYHWSILIKIHFHVLFIENFLRMELKTYERIFLVLHRGRKIVVDSISSLFETLYHPKAFVNFGMESKLTWEESKIMKEESQFHGGYQLSFFGCEGIVKIWSFSHVFIILVKIKCMVLWVVVNYIHTDGVILLNYELHKRFTGCVDDECSATIIYFSCLLHDLSYDLRVFIYCRFWGIHQSELCVVLIYFFILRIVRWKSIVNGSSYHNHAVNIIHLLQVILLESMSIENWYEGDFLAPKKINVGFWHST